MLIRFCLIVLYMLFAYGGLSQTFAITDFGAKGDSASDNTKAIQKAIDKAAEKGGNVIVPAGIYLTGTIVLKSNTGLVLNKNAVLKGQADLSYYPSVKIDYPQRNAAGPQNAKSLIFAEGQHHISITGEGTIDGNGGCPAFDHKLHPGVSRPYGLFFVNCSNVSISNVYLTNSAMWMQRYLNCDFLRLQNLTVFNHANINNDGMDIDDCHNVIVSNCIIDADDDALCFKSEGDRGVKDAVVTNCILSSHASAFKMGTGSIGGFESIQFSNSIIRPSLATTLHHPYKQKGGLVGIDIASVDGALIKDINISNISIDSVETPFFIKLGNRLNRSSVTPANKLGSISGIHINKVSVKNAGPIASAITGYPGNDINDIFLSDIFMEHRGGATVKDTSLNVPEHSDKYPLNRMFDSRKLPACGFYIRHVNNVVLQNIQVKLLGADDRPLLVLDDVKNALINGAILKGATTQPLVKIANSKDIQITGNIPPALVQSTNSSGITQDK